MMEERETRVWQVCAANMMQYSDEIATTFMGQELYGPASYFAAARDIWRNLIAADNLGERLVGYITAHENSTYRVFYPLITQKVIDEFKIRDHVYLPTLVRVLELWETHMAEKTLPVMNRDNLDGEVLEAPWIDQVLAEAIEASRYKLRCSCEACRVRRRGLEEWLGTKEDSTSTAEPSLGKE